jgi:hypothetical protein
VLSTMLARSSTVWVTPRVHGVNRVNRSASLVEHLVSVCFKPLLKTPDGSRHKLQARSTNRTASLRWFL